LLVPPVPVCAPPEFIVPPVALSVPPVDRAGTAANSTRKCVRARRATSECAAKGAADCDGSRQSSRFFRPWHLNLNEPISLLSTRK
jgi:hypothetical protein